MKNWKLFLAGMLVGLFLGGLVKLIRLPKEAQPLTLVTVTPNLTPPPTPTVNTIRVHITGEVNEPGVYSLPEGATVLDAIQAASGETEKSEAEALNLAAVLTDGQRIYIPSNEATTQTFETEQRSSEIISTSLVNINTATKSELEALPGIGPVLAQAIIDYRTNNGFFLAEEDLIKVRGIGNVLFQSLQELITVSP